VSPMDKVGQTRPPPMIAIDGFSELVITALDKCGLGVGISRLFRNLRATAEVAEGITESRERQSEIEKTVVCRYE
jgi:hypothetical protein